MKKLFLTLAAALTCCTPLMADTPTAAPAVPAALADSGISYITATRPAADAKFYVYLCSASWCPPCRAIMPKVVAQYPEIKAAGGEVILLCYDRTPQAGIAYLKKYSAGFPAIMADFRTSSALESKLPGFTAPRGIPCAIFVKPDGTEFHNGHGATLLGWRELLSKLN